MKYPSPLLVCLVLLGCLSARKDLSKPVVSQINVLDSHFRFNPEITQLNVDKPIMSIQAREPHFDISIVGKTAHIRMTFEMENAETRDLEAEYHFPLPHGASLNHLALDINGRMRQGVIVEKQQGRVAFESVTRAQKDPALLEKTGADRYRLRVFPVPAQGTRKIEIGFDQPLVSVGDSLIFWFPLQLNEQFKNSKVSIRVHGHEELPRQAFLDSANTIPLLDFNRIPGELSATIHCDSQRYCPILLLFNSLEIGATPCRESGNHPTDFVYFRPGFKLASQPRKAPAEVLILWDASLLSAKRAVKQDLNFLRNYVVQHPETRFKVQLQKYPLPAERNFTDGRAMIEWLAAQSNDGAAIVNVPDAGSCEEIWYFGSGHAQLFDRPLQASIPFYCINSSPLSDLAWMDQISRISGGLTVKNWETSPSDVIEQVLTKYPRIWSIRGSADPEENWRGKVYEDGMEILVPVKPKASEMVMEIGFNQNSSLEHPVVLPSALPGKGILAREWAAMEIRRLELSPDNKDQVLSLARQYNIVSNATSLIVLDSLSDYLTHGIEPKEEELKVAYHRLKQETENLNTQKTTEHLERITLLYREKKKWILKDHHAQKVEPSSPEVNTNDDSGQVHQLRPSGTDTDSVVIGLADSSGQPIAAGMFSVHSFSESNIFTSSEVMLEDVGANGNSVNSSWDIGDQAEMRTLPGTKIHVREYDPGTSYFARWRKLDPETLYKEYLLSRDSFGSTPAYYLDVSQLLFQKKKPALAATVISNLAAIQVESAEILRLLGRRLMQLDQKDAAIDVFRKVLEIKGEDPHSYRDLALALEQNEEWQEAFDLLCEVITGEWDMRFPEFELLAIEEAQHIWFKSGKTVHNSEFPKAFLEFIPLELRIVVDWDSDLCDIDLWVDHEGERCFYSHRYANDGGLLSRDMTRGYGPEVYSLRKVPGGSRLVQINYFGESSSKILGETTVQVKIFRNYGSKREKTEIQTVRLSRIKEVLQIAEIES